MGIYKFNSIFKRPSIPYTRGGELFCVLYIGIYKIIVGCSNIYIRYQPNEHRYCKQHITHGKHSFGFKVDRYKCRVTTAVTQLLLANYEILCHAPMRITKQTAAMHRFWWDVYNRTICLKSSMNIQEVVCDYTYLYSKHLEILLYRRHNNCVYVRGVFEKKSIKCFWWGSAIKKKIVFCCCI